jgi:hypothetical protein
VEYQDHHQKLNLLFEYLQPAKMLLLYLKDVRSCPRVPSYSSVAAVWSRWNNHQKLKLLFEYLLLLNLSCCIYKFTDVQEVPSYSSVAFVIGGVSTTKS